MKRVPALLCIVGLMFAAIGNAQAMPLTTLFNGASLAIGDKLFDRWTLVSQNASGSRTIDTDNIDVTTLGPAGSNPLDPGPGLHFNVLNNELRVTGDGLYAFIDLQFRFRVSALDPGLSIKDISMTSSSTLDRLPDGLNDLGTFILESIGTAAGLDDLGVADVEYSMLDDVLTDRVTDSATFAHQSSIWVTKNILVWSADVGDRATLDGFTQRFSQAQVAEPGTLALAGIAILAGWRTRRGTGAGRRALYIAPMIPLVS